MPILPIKIYFLLFSRLTNFVLLWKEQYEKIDQSLVINKQLLKEVVSQKAESALQSLVRFKTRGIVAAVIYLFLL